MNKPPESLKIYCPLCGDKMTIVPKDVDHIDCEYRLESGEWADDIHNESLHYGCPSNGCFDEDCPLIMHAAPEINTEANVNSHFKNLDGEEWYSGIYWMEPNEKWSLTCRNR